MTTETVVPFRAPDARPTRRAALAALAAAPGAGLPVVADSASAEDPVVGFVARFDELEANPLWQSDDDAVHDRFGAVWLQIIGEIAATPARTAAGAAAKARMVARELYDGPTRYGDQLAEGLIADLDRLAGESRS